MAPKFSKGNGPELWVIIMEKAWAKIHGSYDRIVSGTVYLTLRDLTGAPGFYLS
jgi:calpain-15